MIDKENRGESPGKSDNKDRPVVASLLLSAALSLTFLFFSPMEIFLGNQKEFIVGLSNMALSLLAVSLVSAAVLELVFLILLKLKRTAYDVVARFALGALLAIYIQGLFLNGSVRSIDNGTPEIDADSFQVVSNFIIWYAILFAPVVIYAVGQKRADNRFFAAERAKAITFVSAALLLMQTAGFVGNIVSTDPSKMDHSYNRRFSFEKLNEVSDDENITVFLFDRMDSYWTDQAFERCPEFKEELTGFTFYQNNIAHYTNTFPSVVQMLTGEYYSGDDVYGFLEEAWKAETLPDTLKENGWDVSLMIDKITTYNSVVQLEGRCDNVKTYDKDMFKINSFGKGGVVPTMTKLSLIRGTPYLLKTELPFTIGSDFSEKFVDYDSDEICSSLTGPDSDLRYYNYLKERGLNEVPEGKKFSFIHLSGAHDDDKRLAALHPNGATFDGSMEIICEYIRQLKEKGLYDNTTIIILGDHARVKADDPKDEKATARELVTGLLIKPAGVPDEPLKYDRYSEMSNDMFGDSILEYAGIENENGGYTYAQVAETGISHEREIQIMNWSSARVFDYGYLYKVVGDARDFDNWEIER